MRFCDKLAKLRRQNNITQEQLADRLKISRQAVSKWESGTSIPDISKMMELCNILNCTLEDLLDDGVIGTSKVESNKTTFTNYFQDFLKYISKVYNMFCSMKFKDVLKCLFELLMIFGIIFFTEFVISLFLKDFILDIFNLIPKIGSDIARFLNCIVTIGLIILGLIIFFHLFKIRYLDYYEIIEDKNISEKVVEKPIEETKQQEYSIPKKEKIIIRDPKHATFSFFEFLSKILIFILKVLVVFALVFLVMLFAFFLIIFFIVVWHIPIGSLFFHIAIAILGILLFIYCFLEVFFFFLVSNKQNFQRIFIIAISGIVLFGLGGGLGIATYLSYDSYDTASFSTIKTSTIEMQDDLAFDISRGYYNFKYNYEIDNSIDNIKMEVKSIGEFKIYLQTFEYNFQKQNQKYTVVRPHFNRNAMDIYNMFIDSIKEKKSLISVSDMSDMELYQITIKMSKENYQKIKENNKNYNELFSNIYGS